MNKQSIYDRIMSRTSGEASAIQDSKTRRQGTRWLNAAGLSLLGIAIGVGGYAAARYDLIGSFLSQPAIAETNGADASPADTPFVQHVKQAGLQSCSNVFPFLGTMLTSGSQFSVQSSWNTKTPDKHAVQALVGMNYATEGYSGAAAGVVFAAPTGSLCEGSMVRVAPFAVSCEQMPAVLPKGSKLANNLAQVSVYELPDNGGNAMLLPTGSGCVVISVASASANQGNAK